MKRNFKIRSIAILAGISLLIISCGIFNTAAPTDVGQVETAETENPPITGMPTTEATTLPTVPSFTAKKVVSGFGYGCAIVDQGQVVCWRYTGEKSPADGEIDYSKLPIPIPGLENVVDLAPGDQVCAVTAEGILKCFDPRKVFESGDPNQVSFIDVPELTAKVTNVFMRSDITCVFTEDRRTLCWGENKGRFGDGTTNSSTTPVESLVKNASMLALGSYHACATYIGDVSFDCWGSSEGIGWVPGRNWYTPMIWGEGTAITAGSRHTCFIDLQGSVECFGYMVYRKAFREEDLMTTAIMIPGLETGVTQVSATSNFTCALTNDGRVFCWGGAVFSGDPATKDIFQPVELNSLAGQIQSLGTGVDDLCAITQAGGIYCWSWRIYDTPTSQKSLENNQPVAIPGFGKMP